jgi:hypothetical protein
MKVQEYFRISISAESNGMCSAGCALRGLVGKAEHLDGGGAGTVRGEHKSPLGKRQAYD